MIVQVERGEDDVIIVIKHIADRLQMPFRYKCLRCFALPSLSLSVRPSVCLSVCSSVSLPVFPSVFLSVRIYLVVGKHYFP